MDEKAKHIITKKDFDPAWQRINQIFYIDREMPSQVFKKPFSGFMFEEFDWAISDGEFWDVFLKPLSIVLDDTYILTASVNPHPVTFFYQNFGYYNMIKFPISNSKEDYSYFLHNGPSGGDRDALLFNSETVVWVPSSGKWAIWGERSYGACVLAFADDNTKQAAKPFLQTWKSAQEASDIFISLNFEKRKTPVEFEKALVQNYPI